MQALCVLGCPRGRRLSWGDIIRDQWSAKRKRQEVAETKMRGLVKWGVARAGTLRL